MNNYDNFSYNLYQLIGSINPNIKVVRNNALTVDDVAALNPEAIILSPGPGKPNDAGICIPIIQELSGRIPLLGVCLGHQAIFEAFGSNVDHAKHLMHGKSSQINIDNASPLFKGLPQTIQVARYHSLSAQEKTLPWCLRVIRRGGDEVMQLSTAAAGVPVAKHGNRAASSKCGAADVLEELGVKIDIAPERSAKLLKQINICFLFPQKYHIAMKYVAPVRKELSIRTVFNILGPLSNPAGEHGTSGSLRPGIS